MARNGYEPKSKYLKMYYESFYDFYYLSYKRYTSFKNGQEEEFLESVKELEQYYKEHGGHMDVAAENALKSIMDYSSLDWKMIWDKVDLRAFHGPLDEYIEYLAHKVNWNDFKEKVNKSNEIEVVERLYYIYCDYKSISNEKRDEAYNEYLLIALKRKEKTPEDIIYEMVNDFEETFERGHGVDTVETHLQRSKMQLFKNILKIANLNTLVDYRGEKVTLKNLLFYRILKYGKLTEWCDIEESMKPHLKVDNEKELKDLFNACDDLTFTGEPLDDKFKEYDRVTLNILMNKVEDAIDIFDERNYQLYNQNEIESLLENGVYQNSDSPFTDRFASVIRFIMMKGIKSLLPRGVNHEELLNLIYSKKIKVISYPTLMLIKKLLTEREYKNYLDHLKGDEIHVYFGDYLELHGDKSRIITLDNNCDLNSFEKYESKKIQKELNSKVYKK